MTTIQGDIGTGLGLFFGKFVCIIIIIIIVNWVYTWGLFERASWSVFFLSFFSLGHFTSCT